MTAKWSDDTKFIPVTPTGTDEIMIIRGVTNAKAAIASLSLTASQISDFSTASRAVVLTGFSATNAVVAATDTMLVGFNKLQGQISNLGPVIDARIDTHIGIKDAASGFAGFDSNKMIFGNVEGSGIAADAVSPPRTAFVKPAGSTAVICIAVGQNFSIGHTSTGDARITDISTYTPNFTVNSNGSVSMSGALSVAGAGTFSSTLGVTGATTLSSTLGVTGAATLSSTLGVTGATTLSSTLNVSGATTLTNGLNVTGDTELDGNVLIVDDANFGGLATFGPLNADTVTTGALQVNFNGSIGNNLGVANIITANTLGVVGNATIGGMLSGGLPTSGPSLSTDNTYAIWKNSGVITLRHKVSGSPVDIPLSTDDPHLTDGTSAFGQALGGTGVILTGLNAFIIGTSSPSQYYLKGTTGGNVVCGGSLSATTSLIAPYVSLNGTAPYVGLINSSLGTNLKSWTIDNGSDTNFAINAWNDALSLATTAMWITKTAGAPPTIGGVFKFDNSASWNVTSDRKFKKADTIKSACCDESNKVMSKIRVVNFQYTEDFCKPVKRGDKLIHKGINHNDIQLGFIAQELKEVCPEAVTEDENGNLSYRLDPLIYRMFNSHQDLLERVAALETKH